MVVLLINKFFYEKGGTERYFFLLSAELERRGHDVVHFSMRHPENRPSPYSEYFVSQKDYDTPRGLVSSVARGASFIRSREAAKKIRALIKKHRPAVAHLHNIYHQITPSIIPELAAAGIPAVMTLHDYKLICPNYSLFARGEYCYLCEGGRLYKAASSRCSSGSFSKSALLAIEAYWQRNSGVYDSIRKFIAPSRYMRDAIVAAGINARRVMYLPGFLPPEDSRENVPSSANDTEIIDGLPESYLLYFGRLSPEKGLKTLLDAAQSRPDIPFVICGDGLQAVELHDEMKTLALNNVSFTGYVKKPLLDKIIRRARATVVPTLSPENAPFTVLESAAAGVPVIVSDMGGLPEMADVVGGWVFRHGDSVDLAAKIDEVWSNPSLARERGAGGKKSAQEYFERAKHVDAIETLYHEVGAER